MNLWSNRGRRLFRRGSSPSLRPRPYRPVLECLEDRGLPSGGYTRVDLASDVPGLAPVTDPNLVNPWGVSYSPTGPFWFADNRSGVSDLLDGQGRPFPLVVTVPGAVRSVGTPTGTVFNGGPGFVVAENGTSAPGRFLFATEDGTISGWTAVVDPARALVAVDNSPYGAIYKGLALAVDPDGRSFLYTADFGRGGVDVFDQDFRPVERPGSFRDPDLPDGYAPFNIQNINDLLVVTYARRDVDEEEDVPGPGNGFIDVYDTGGDLVRRFASRGPLDSPWGLAVAPAGFGPFGGALLVGNTGDGHINAYDPGSGAFLGTLADDGGVPITVPTLWALTFGNGHEGGASDTLFFTAGVDYEEHGLFGAIQAPGRRGADTAGRGTFDPRAPGEPGDYPLPPRNGPTLQNLDGGPLRATPVLLPMSDSSMALAPTLSIVPQPRSQPDTPAGPVGAYSPGQSVVTPPSDPDTAPVPETAGDPQPPEDRQHSSFALGGVGDLINMRASPGLPAGGPRPDASRQVRLGADSGPVSVLPPIQWDLSQVSSEGRPRSPGSNVSGIKPIEPYQRGRWAELSGGLLVALGLPMIYALCILRPLRNPRLLRAERLRGASGSDPLWGGP